MNSYTRGWLEFSKIAKARGYTIKVVGDEAFQVSCKPQSKIIRLKAIKGRTLTIYQTDLGVFNVTF